jgi:ferrous iron transport protein B
MSDTTRILDTQLATARLSSRLDSSFARKRLILVGNPNVGKSVLFGYFTGRYVTVANYPGTTVEITAGRGTIGTESFEVIDTPGTNGLIPQSEDERVTRDILLDLPGATLLQVGDLKNLRRSLFLSVQIAEMGLPFTLGLNMADEADELGITVDVEKLSSLLGISVVVTSALRRWNVDRLGREATAPRCSPLRVSYSEAIEEGIRTITSLIPEDLPVSARGIAVAVLAGDETLIPFLEEIMGRETLAGLDEIRNETQTRLTSDLAFVINRERLRCVDRLVEEVYGSPAVTTGSAREWFGSISMHPVWGIPVLVAVLFAAWWFVGRIGAGEIVDIVESVIFNAWLNPWIIEGFDFTLRFPHTHLVDEGTLTAEYVVTADPLSSLQTVAKLVHDLFVGPYGIITMALTYAIAIVLPVVVTFFIFFGLLEDSGYLPRLAVMLNRLFRLMGLNGKAVLPMVLGLGCDTMATLTTRILETRKERVIVTLLLALGIPCSAQLGVIMAMLGLLSPVATLIWLGVVGGTIFFVGALSSRILAGESSDFIMEIPPIRMPRIGNILVKVMARLEWYLREAVPLFIVGTLVLFLFDLTGLLRVFQSAISPLIVGMLSLPTEAANAFLIGFLRRDYGAAGLFMMQRAGELDPIQTLVSLTVITLFIPCIANLFMMVKERGLKTALWMTAFIIPYAFGIGWLLNIVLRGLNASLGG